MPTKPNPPTERQLAYAAKLNISIPENVTKEQIGDLISMAVDNDKPSSERHRAFADYFGINASEHIGKKSLFELIQFTLANSGRDKDLMAWFTYRVYRNLTNAADNTPISGPGDPQIQAIATTLASNAKIVKSARRYEGKELIYFGEWTAPDGNIYLGGSKNTAAYKAAESSLKQSLRLPKNQAAESSPTQSLRLSKKQPERMADAPVPRIQTAKPISKRAGFPKTIVRLVVWGTLLFIVIPIFLMVFVSFYRG